MKSLSIRASLMATLCLLTLMLIAGALLGTSMLARANDRFILAEDIAAEARGINNIYMDTSRARLALTRVYTDVRDSGKQASASPHLATAQNYLRRGQAALQALGGNPHASAIDVRTREELIAATRTLYGSLEQAAVALRAEDAEAFQRINLARLTVEGASVSRLLERFQQHASATSSALMAQRDAEYRMVNYLVGAGIALALVLVCAVHYFLKHAVLFPVEHAISVLDRLAGGDLTGEVAAAGNTEIGRLMACIADMQLGFARTVADVRQGAQAIRQVAHDVASGNAELSARTETQASSLQQTAASMEELTSTMQQTADNTRQARELVGVASDTVAASTEVMVELDGTMAQIDDASRKVAAIIAVIDGIAFQTNLLALNAAVEAARAGAQGRGFAVVASEVRTLAQRSAAAAREIKELIGHSAAKVRCGSELAYKARGAMAGMADSVRRVSDIVNEIADASREQSLGIVQVNQAVAQMDEVTQRNAALVEQAAAATQAMRRETACLIDAVGVFRLPGEGIADVQRDARAGRRRLDGRMRHAPILV